MTANEVAEVINGIRDKVRERYQKSHPDIFDFELPTLDALGQARDRADGKVAAIGRANPRPPGLLNAIIQKTKEIIARSLNWLVRDQVEFNRAVVSYMDRNFDATAEQNHNIMRIANEFAAFRKDVVAVQAQFATRMDRLDEQTRDLLKNWVHWRGRLEETLDQIQIEFLRAIRDIEARTRTGKEEQKAARLRLHGEFIEQLARSTDEIQTRFWDDLKRLSDKHEEQIQTELRLIRRRQESAPAPVAAAPAAVTAPPARFDYGRFEERFRGGEDYVSGNQEFYLPFFADRWRVVDLGCGRGEFLDLLRTNGINGTGVDLDPSALAACREKGIEVAEQGIIEYLAGRQSGEFDAIFAAHVVEHLPPQQLPEFFDLAYGALEPGGLLALETPNPGCLAIFAGDFYVDPTHYKPLPSAQLDFHLREAGFGKIEVHERNPAVDLIPEVRQLDEIEGLKGFRERFFGGLDYAIIARKIGA